MFKQNDSSQGIYTKEEMLAQAASVGYKVSVRLFDDWVQAGLLGNAEFRDWPGRTHGSGSTARWSQQQHKLFLALLRHRQKGNIRENGALCNIPVWLWLYWGELGGVSLKQVRRAMHTWTAYWRGQSYATVRKSARELVALASYARGTNKRELVEELSHIGVSGADIDDEELRYLLDQVIGPHAKGPEQAPFSTDYIASMLGIRSLAMQQVDDVLAQSDALWEWAKVAQLTACTEYQQMQPEFASDPHLGDRFPRQTVTALIESSCYYLFTLLGIAYQRIVPYGVPTIFCPSTWQTGKVKASIQTRIVPTALLLTNGTSFSYLENLVALQYQESSSIIRCQIPFI
jgi:hypothetical protein